MYQVIDQWSPFNTPQSPVWNINSFYNLVKTDGSLSLPNDPASQCIGRPGCYDWQTTLYAANLTNALLDCRVTNPSYSCDSVKGGCSMAVQENNVCQCSGLEEVQVQFEVPSDFFVVQVNGVFIPSANTSNWVWSGGKLQWPSFIWGPTGTVGDLGPRMPTWAITALVPSSNASNTMGTVATYSLSGQWSSCTALQHWSDVDHWQDASVSMPIDQSTLVFVNPNTSALTSSGFYTGWFSGQQGVGGGFLGALDWYITGDYSFTGSIPANWKPNWPGGAPLPTPWYTITVDKTNPNIWSCGSFVQNQVVFQVWSTGEWDAVANGYTTANNHYARGGKTPVVWGNNHTAQCQYCTAAHLNSMNLLTPDWSTSWYSYTQSQSPNGRCLPSCKSGCGTPGMTCSGYTFTYDFDRTCPAASSSSSTGIKVSSSSSSSTKPGFVTSSPTSAPAPTSSPSFVKGDPSFVGLRGQSFQVHGIDGAVYNIISDPAFQLNSRFTFLTGPRPCPVMPSTGLPSSACWAHDGSYLADVGLKTTGGDRFYLSSGGATEGFHEVTVNGRAMKVGDIVPLTYADPAMGRGFVVLNSTHEVTVQSGDFRIEVENSDDFVNLRSVSLSAGALSAIRSHGLLGQTWNPKKYSGKVRDIEGDVDDYVVSEDHVFGDGFVFNKFSSD